MRFKMFCPHRKETRHKPDSIYWSLFVRTIEFIVIVGIVCAVYVWICRLLEVPVANESVLRCSYIHIGIFVAIVTMGFTYITVYVSLKVNESIRIQELYRQYFTTDTLRNIRSVAMVERLWNEEKVPEVGRPYFQVRLPDGNYKGPIKILNIDKLCTDAIRRRPWTEKQDESRRAIANLYRLAYRLYESGNINKRALRDICTMDAFALLFDVIEPMEAIVNDDYNWYEFYELMKIMKDDYQAICRKTQSHDVHSQYLDDKFKEWVPAEIGV